MEYRSIHGQISDIANKLPDNIAIEYGCISVTYKQLEDRSSKIACFLYENAGQNVNIAIMLDRKPELVEAILGVIKFGGIFVPLDPGFPESRLSIMLETARVDWVITEAVHLKKLNSIAGNTGWKPGVLVVDEIPDGNAFYSNLDIFTINGCRQADRSIPDEILSKNCYIYFTSGSTGRPKAILGRHRSLKHFIDWEIKQLKVDENFKVSQFTTPSFDACLRDIFVPLCSGASLCIPENRDIVMNPEKMASWIDEKGISLVHMVPSLFRALMSVTDSPEAFMRLRFILLAGEMLRGSDLKKFFELFENRIQLINLYGTTETTLVKTFYPVVPSDIDRINIPVGKPIDKTEILLLDSNMKTCKRGSTGEIYIRTPYITSGYYNAPEMTKKVFLRNPFSDNPQDIIYKTGDLGRFLPDGNLECMGRIDNQIKVRGVRIEAAEIENLLLQHGALKEAVVAAVDDTGGDKLLCAYYVSYKNVRVQELKEYLQKELPDYMIPSSFIELKEMPRTLNGKIDKKSLPDPRDIATTQTGYTEPRNETEKILAGLWEEILSVKNPSITDSFFDLGGHSLKAAALVTAIHRAFDTDIPLKTVFELQTIEGLAQYITEAEKNAYTSIQPAKEQQYYKLSSAQMRLFVLNKLEQDSHAYNMPGAVVIEGRLDKERVEMVFRQLIKRHEALRTVFEFVNGTPLQHVRKEAEFKLVCSEMEENWESDEAVEKRKLLDILKSFIRPFDLSRAPLLRAELVSLSSCKHALLFDMHHIISDGISQEILIDEFTRLYRGEELPSLKLQYKDYSEWQNRLFESGRINKQEEYWLDVLSGEIPVLNLPADFSRPSRQSFEGGTVYIALEKELSGKIRAIAASTQSTLYMVLLAAYNVLLYRYTGQEDIIVGSPVAGRNHADLDHVIGIFINMLAMRNHPAGDKSFKDFLGEVRMNCIRAYENQECQFERLVEKLELKRDLGRNPLFDTVFILQNMEFKTLEAEGLNFISYEFENQTAKFDLTFTAIEKGEAISIELNYSKGLFKESTVKRLAENFVNILRHVAEDINVPLCSINMLSRTEHDKLTMEFNDTAVKYEKEKLIHELFEAQARRTPSKTALVFEGRDMTYCDLNKRSNSLARVLRDKGVRTGSIVALLARRSLEMVVGVLAILKAGGAYLPIDPDYPKERIEYMLDDSGADAVLTYHTVNTGNSRMVLDLNDESLYMGNGSNLNRISDAHSLAYVIYTSGSTGRPKGVMIEHAAINNFIEGVTRRICFSSDKTILALTTISFDIFVLESLLPLAKGLRLVIANEEQQVNSRLLSKLIIENGIDMLQITPSRLRLLMETEEGSQSISKVKEIMVGGEAFPEKLLAGLKKITSARIYNMYGPTETTVWSTISDLTGSGEVNIGTPIANTQVYILDKNHSLMPLGAVGELYIAGDGLARGYMKRPELTAEKFIPNPYLQPSASSTCLPLMYRTGDLARWREDGNLEYIGRADNQIKLRGYRIELSEIEKCLSFHESINDAVCTIHTDDTGEPFLTAYYTSAEELSAAQLRGFLSKTLPGYMLPDVYMHLEKIPLTLNGKLYRKGLPKPGNSRPKLETEYIAPETGIQKKLVNIWEEVLNRDLVGIDDNFFELGGNSISLIVIHQKLDSLFPGKLTVADIFSNPTISKLAQHLAESKSSVRPELQGTEFPADYLSDGDGCEDMVLDTSISNDLYSHMLSLCNELSFDISDFLLSAYVYLLHRITGQEKVEVCTIIHKQDAIILNCDLSDLRDFLALTTLVGNRKRELMHTGTILYDACTKAGAKRQDRRMIVGFADNVPVGDDMTDVCDILLKLYKRNDTLNLSFEYDSTRIKPDKAEEIFMLYLDLIKNITEKLIKEGD